MSIGENFLKVKSEIPGEVTLISVSKTRLVDEIKEVYNLGGRDFGENKVQELMDKYEELPKDIRWHLIGHLQRNKVKYLVGRVYLIHSLDSVRLLEEIEKQYSKSNITAEVLIQINIGREESKTGIMLEDLDELIEACEKCSSVKVKGIMTTIPKGDDESCKYYFVKTKEVYDNLNAKNYKNISMDILSMGMSGDYKVAMENGSNMVRIGSGVFGERNYNEI
ncbi:MAG: YggS family pyridoxal phosphate-dependent enzyme [Clostridium sp.]|uniref:YggS family pyridoxal phosphate-dependent enzyme n=1 Tax=Clostridium sp. TaxID=1506 RepID=UPI00302147B7